MVFRGNKLKVDFDSVLTTGLVAKFLRFAPRTVANLIDKGMLKGFKVPSSKDRRVTVRSLLSFMRENDLPVYLVPFFRNRILIFSKNLEIDEVLKTCLEHEGYSVVTTSSQYTACLSIGVFRPHVIFIDCSSPVEAFHIIEPVREDDLLYATFIVGFGTRSELLQYQNLCGIRRFDAEMLCPLTIGQVLDQMKKIDEMC